jgi:putative ABC transport system substrate-binding protein
MRRRAFIGALGSAAIAWPVMARAQQGERVRRVGILMPYPPSALEIQTRVRAFKDELQSRGWAAGVNIQFDERWTTDDMELIRAAATNLVELKSDAIFAVGGRVVPILMQMTRTIPIIAPASDPVALGWAQSLARPGGNVTGFGGQELSVIGKGLQTLKEIAPNVSRIGIIYNPDNPTGAHFARWFESAARTLGMKPLIIQVHGLPDIERAINDVAAQPNGGLFFPLDLTLQRFTQQIIEVVMRRRVPAIYSERPFVASGGLVYYGVDRIDLYRRCATYVDRILRGEKASDLPYQQPTEYELVINLKTAKALGLTVPPALLATADEVIE